MTHYNIASDDLYQLYIIENKTLKEVTAHYGCAQSTISYHLRKYGIYKVYEFNTDHLYQLYITENKTLQNIANHYRCSRGTISKYLQKAGIKKSKDIQYNSRRKFQIDRDELYQLYVDGKTQPEIAEYYGCSLSLIVQYTSKYNLPRLIRNQQASKHLLAILTTKKGKIVSEYVNTQTLTSFECQYGHQWETLPKYIAIGTWCPTCMNYESRVNRFQNNDRKHLFKNLNKLKTYALKHNIPFTLVDEIDAKTGNQYFKNKSCIPTQKYFLDLCDIFAELNNVDKDQIIKEIIHIEKELLSMRKYRKKNIICAAAIYRNTKFTQSEVCAISNCSDYSLRSINALIYKHKRECSLVI